MENLSLSDLLALKGIFENELKLARSLVDGQRGFNFEQYEELNYVYWKNPRHEKLEKINKRIEEIKNSI